MKTHEIRLKSGLAIAIHEYGIGDKVFVLLHGIPGSSRSWHKVATLLAQAGARVLVPDLLGFGQSSQPCEIDNLWLEAQAKALLEGIRSLGSDSFHLVGHDYGGPVALTMYSMEPRYVKGLTLLATNTFTDTPIPAPLAMIKIPWLGRIWSKIVFSRPSLYMMIRQGVGNGEDKVNPSAALGNCRQSKAIGKIFDAALRDLATRYRPVQEILSQVRVPTTVVWGTQDPFFSVEQGRRTAANIPAAQFRCLEGAGHFLPEERPDEVHALLLGK